MTSRKEEEEEDDATATNWTTCSTGFTLQVCNGVLGLKFSASSKTTDLKMTSQ